MAELNTLAASLFKTTEFPKDQLSNKRAEPKQMDTSPVPAFLNALPGPPLRSVGKFDKVALSPRHGNLLHASPPAATLGRTQPIKDVGISDSESTYTVTVLQDDRSTQIQVNRDTNLRRALLDNKIDVYTLSGKLLNCGGNGQCGTCIIAVEEGLDNTNQRAAREEKQLQSKPPNWRLACRSLIDGDVTIRTKPKV